MANCLCWLYPTLNKIDLILSYLISISCQVQRFKTYRGLVTPCGGIDMLTHWGRLTHIYVNKLTIIGSDNGLSPGGRQAIIWTNDGIFLIGPLGINKRQWNLNRNLKIFIQENAFENVVWKMAAILSRPQCVNFGAGNRLLRHGRHQAIT